MEYKVKPWEHQLKMIERSTYQPNLGLFFDTGTGKTGTCINITRVQFNMSQRIMRTLILAPLSTLYNWRAEFYKHSTVKPEKITILEGTGKKRVDKFESRAFNKVTNLYDINHIFIVNYDALRNDELLTLIKKWKPEILVCDESHMLKESKADRSKNVYELSKTAQHRYLLTGTPVLNSELDIFMQYKILDLGQTFGTNFFVFRSKYFYDASPFRSFGARHIADWRFRHDMLEEFKTKMYRIAGVVKKEECLDLPPLVKKTVYVEMSPAQKKVYLEVKRDYYAYIEQAKAAVSATIALTKIQKLLQIASGFVITDEGTVVDFGDDIPRLDAVKDILMSVKGRHKTILWCSYIHNYLQLSKLCDRLDIKYVLMTGQQSAKEKQESLLKFRDDKEIGVIIANRASGGTGVEMTAASYSIVYSRNYSLAEELQSEARNYRAGSNIHESIIKIDLCSKGSAEEVVLESLKKKEQIAGIITDLGDL
jgi:SNF2 family DNA or RNA helicase